MSAPNTNIETQERRHKPSITALRLSIWFAVLALIGFVALQVFAADDPAPATFEPGGEASAAID